MYSAYTLLEGGRIDSLCVLLTDQKFLHNDLPKHDFFAVVLCVLAVLNRRSMRHLETNVRGELPFQFVQKRAKNKPCLVLTQPDPEAHLPPHPFAGPPCSPSQTPLPVPQG